MLNSGRRSPVSVFQVETFDVTSLADDDPFLTTFMAERCYMEEPPPLREDDLDDNHDLDLPVFEDDLDDYPSHMLSPLGLPWSSNECTESELLTACINEVDPASRALYAMEQRLRDTGLSRNSIYSELREKEAILRSTEFIRAHMDNGSMVCTTNVWGLLWHITTVRDPPALKVADNYKHYPTHQGYLRIPIRGGLGHKMVHCYYTPSLEATIVSPDAAGRELQCRGYTSVSNFDGVGCSLTLHHCRRVSQDVEFPLTLVQGLLYTDPLIPPTTGDERCRPMPPPVLHVQKISKADTPPDETPESDVAPLAPPVDDDTSIVDDGLDGDTPVASTVAPEDEDASAAGLADDFVDMFPWANNCGCQDGKTCPCEPSDSPDTTPPPLPPDVDQCKREGCCAGHPPDLPDISPDVAEKLLYLQRLGFQRDCPIEEMHEHADGIPMWTEDCNLACGPRRDVVGARQLMTWMSHLLPMPIPSPLHLLLTVLSLVLILSTSILNPVSNM